MITKNDIVFCENNKNYTALTNKKQYIVIDYNPDGYIKIEDDHYRTEWYPSCIFYKKYKLIEEGEERKFKEGEKEKEGGTMSTIKEYFEKHKDSIITIIIIVLLDHFVFNGKFRDKIEEIVGNLFKKTTKELSE